ncbi:MAG: MtrB/PioB family outer membrane beta-barrel protein [Desulfobulbales bacterium]|nr:MtrB/PioB family outer membrane beta-barrel protein [Desulfobulbales bacterium]
MKKTLHLCGLFFLFIGLYLPVLAGEADDWDLLDSLDIEEDYAYEFPEIPPAAHIHLGYRFVDLEGAARVFQYEYLEDSLMAGAELRMFPFPHRFFFDFDLANKEDYLTDLRYAYGDLVLLRWLNNTYYHNTKHVRLHDYNPMTPAPGVDIRDTGREYGVTARQNKFSLMVKSPRFPLHVYFDGFHLVKDGNIQQRNLLGSGYYNNLQRVSQERKLDNTTRIFTVGANSHLGFVEVDFAHVEKRFDVDGNPVLEDAYTASGYRPAGIYKHSSIPELEGSGNTLRIHTSYSGKWVAAASFLQNDRENNFSGAQSDVMIGAGSLMWSPKPGMTLSLRYTHRDLDHENPAHVTVADPGDSAAVFPYPAKKPVSSKTDTLSLTGKYRPIKGLTFRAKYDYRKVDRTNGGIWKLPESTTRNGFTLAADSRLHSTVLLNLKYVYKNVDDPAYNSEPEHSNGGRFALTWLPHPAVSLLFSYELDRQERDNLNFAGSGEYVGNDLPWYRETDLDNARIIGTFQVTPKLTLTGTYSYLQYDVVQDLVHENLAGDAQVDPDVPMEQNAHVFTVGISYHLSDALQLLGEISYTRSEAGFFPSSEDLLAPVSVASFSQMEQSYLLFHLNGHYSFNNGLGMELDYRYGDLEDRLDNIHDDIEDGEAHIVILSATKKW